MKLVIGNQNYSSWSMRPWLFVAYHDLDIEVEKISLSDLEALRRRFAHGKVPVLVDGFLEIWDSIAILEYLVELFPHTRGWPDDPEARAVARSVSAEMHSGFSALRNELPMNCRRFFPGYSLSDDSLSDVRRIQQIWNMCRERYGRDGPWLFGRFTVADAMYAPVVMRFRSAEVELDAVSREYFETMHECDAVKRWLAEGRAEAEIVDYDELDWPSTELP
ncbi:MAG: glutathione S-transferase [Gammaproteobacteria bacterium]|nr:glutathione S-transferase [Gammaproteobacteria bacterium]MYD76791.1 glutathione S-transferase [Gammaproteobacteria bacterium]MYJ51529.1 glutathione S-transferase [Gammaproteobacteria bacterium]